MPPPPQVSISERVYEHREWEIHHRRWAMLQLAAVVRDLGNPHLIEFHGGIAAHLARMKSAGQEVLDEFAARYARGRHMTASQLRADR